MTSEHIWTWLRAKGKLFKVISDPENGIIEVINEHGEILIRKTNLTRRQVELVEKNFLRTVAKKLNERVPGNSRENFDPSIA